MVNPLAGLGGSLGLKGSDGEVMRERLAGLTAEQRHRALDRVERALQPLAQAGTAVHFTAWAGDMGAAALSRLGLPHQVLGQAAGETSTAEDTRNAVRALRDRGVDLILFAGGDGTARDIFDVVGSTFPGAGYPGGGKNALRCIRCFTGGCR